MTDIAPTCVLLVCACRQKGCTSVLSNDSDFLIHNVAGYAPLWGLEVVAAEHTATAFVFTREKLARVLNIRYTPSANHWRAVLVSKL